MKAAKIRNILLALCMAFACSITFVSSASAASARPAQSVVQGTIVNDQGNKDQFCLGITQGSTQIGAKAIIWNCNLNPDQNWAFAPDYTNQIPGDPTFYNVVNENGLCLGIPGGSLNWGVVPVQWWCNGHLDQDWEMATIAGGYFYLMNWNDILHGTGANCLGVSGKKVYMGATPVMWGCDSSYNQTWYMG